MQVSFRSLSETTPGQAWQSIFHYAWPGWKNWYLQRANEQQPHLKACRIAMNRHMPEYLPVWEKLIEQVDGDELVAQFLSFWTPPRYLVNCSQAVLAQADSEPVLIRNYDLDPRLSEATLLCSNWTGGRKVMGLVEGMGGLADGMNDKGLCISLTFGGRVISGRGFGVPLIIRYILEVCCNVTEAIEILRSIPSHMSYNVTVLDKNGDFATVFLAPDRPALVHRVPYTTNHQLGIEWPFHARRSQTVERAEHLAFTFNTPMDEATLIQRFLSPPLYRTDFDGGFGTVYTAVYRPYKKTVELIWPNQASMSNNLEQFSESKQLINYGATPTVDPIHHFWRGFAT